MTDFKPGQYKTTDGRDAEVKYVDDDSALYGHIWSYTGERLARIWLSDGTDTYTRAGDNLIPPAPLVRVEWWVIKQFFEKHLSVPYTHVYVFDDEYRARNMAGGTDDYRCHRVELIGNEVQKIEVVK